MTGSVTTAVIKDGNGAAITGGVRMLDSSGTGSGPFVPMSVPSDLSGNAVDLSQPSQVVGNVAAAATDSGNPVKGGAVYHSTIPTYTDGQRTEFCTDNRGALRVTVGNGSQNSTVGAVGRGTGGQAGLYTASQGVIFNGSTFDPITKPSSVSRIASAAASTNPTSAKNSAGEVFRVTGNNVKASVVYLKLYNKATAPTVGTDAPFMTIPLAASSVFNHTLDGLYMGTGIAYGFTTDAADNGTTALASGDVLGFSLAYS